MEGSPGVKQKLAGNEVKRDGVMMWMSLLLGTLLPVNFNVPLRDRFFFLADCKILSIPDIIHSQKQPAHWAVDVTAQVDPC